MNVLILSRKHELFSTRRLKDETIALGHTPIVQDPEAPDIQKTVADVVIPRFGTWRFEDSLKTLEFFERRQIRSLNRSSALREARNKWMSYLLLRENDLPVPLTSTAFKKELPKTFPYVVKPIEGSKGDNVTLISNAADLMKLPDDEWLVQEYVAHSKGRDHRLIVLDGGVIAAMERKAADGEFRSNMAKGGTATALEPSDLEKTIAIEATKTLGLRFSGVDIVMSSSGPCILEVNGSPGLQGIETATGKNIARMIIEAAIKLKG